jgi:hypothetical protein
MKPGETIPWYGHSLVGVEVGPTGAGSSDDRFMSNITGQLIIDRMLAAKAQYVVLFLKDQSYCYYNSRIAPKPHALRDRDLLSECITAAKPHKIPVIAYCQVQYDAFSWDEKPEWRMKDNHQKDIHGRLCLNTGYIDRIKALIMEMMAYGIAGFHFDMLDQGFGEPYGCWCPVCQDLYQSEYRENMPEAVDWEDASWDKMLQFRYDASDRFCKEIYRFVKESDASLSVDFNFHGTPPFSWEVGQRPVQHAANGDFLTGETLPWIFGYDNISLLVQFAQGARQGIPVQGVGSRSIYTYHDYTVRPVQDIRYEVMTTLAHGGFFTMVDKAGYDGWLDPLVYERLGEVFSEAIAKEKCFQGFKPYGQVGIFISNRSRDWYARFDAQKYLGAIVGVHKAFQQSHIPMAFLMDENLSLDMLEKHPVIVMPSAAILTVEEVSMFSDYVTHGGSLLITGPTGLYDIHGHPENLNMLAELMGAEYIGLGNEKGLDSYIRMDHFTGEIGNQLCDGIRADGWDLLVNGNIYKYKAKGAQCFGRLLSGFRSSGATRNVWEQMMSADDDVENGPAVMVNQYGRGRVITIACDLDRAYAENYRMPEHRMLLANCIRLLYPDRPVILDGPLNTELVTTIDGEKRKILHLVTFNGTLPTTGGGHLGTGKLVLPPIMEESMFYKAKVRIRNGFRSAKAYNPETVIVVNGDSVDITTSEVHEMIMLDWD